MINAERVGRPDGVQKRGAVRISPEGDNFLNGISVQCAVVLGQNPDLARPLCRFYPAKVPAAKRDLTAVGDGLRDGPDKSAFSGTVWTDEHEPLSSLKRQGQVCENPVSAKRNAYMGCL